MAALTNPFNQFKIHLGPLIQIPSVVWFARKLDADRRMPQEPQIVNPTRPVPSGVVDERRVGAPILYLACDLAAALDAVDAAPYRRDEGS